MIARLLPPDRETIAHVYVHIPFCHRICPYCSFYKHTPGRTSIPDFFQALLAETRHATAQWPVRPRTIYFGGGTPTFPSAAILDAFLAEWKTLFDTSQCVEWTFEANPMTFDAEKIRVLKAHGVNRISLGVQAWDVQTLETLGRDHSPAQASHAYEILRQAEMPRVNIDLMFAIPGQSLETWQQTLQATAKLQPDSVSAYNLNYEEDTEFFEKLQAGQFHDDPDQGADFFLTAVEQLSSVGLHPYEVSNYARPDAESIHNWSYWQGEDYLGLGPGAYSTVWGQRWKNLPDTPLYITGAQNLAGSPQVGEAPPLSPLAREIEEITPLIWRQERLALLLRTRQGVSLELIGPRGEALTLCEPLLEHGAAVIEGDRLVLTAQGRLIADSAAVQVLPQ